MKVVKKINNNVAVCIDNNNRELIAFGNGIGFPKTPYEISDISNITRTFYGVNATYINLLNEINEDVFEISAKIVDYASTKIVNELSENIVFTLADHINFTIKRYEENMQIKMPFAYDIQHLYETEMEIGKKSIKFINRVLNIHLSEIEAVGIAIHFINAQNIISKEENVCNEDTLIEKITSIIETDFDIEINKSNFNYSRFVTHIQYLFKRANQNKSIESSNHQLFETLKESFPKTYDSVLKIKEYVAKDFKWVLSDEELLYLMIHVNRLCSREDCNH